MATATVQVESVGGYAAQARCFALDPPYDGYPYVTICVAPSFGETVKPRCDIYPGTPSGACAERSLMARGGSFTLHDEPNTPERLEGAYWLALMMLGGYQVSP